MIPIKKLINVYRLSFFVLITCVLLGGCKQQVRTEAEFFKWINNPENGLIKSKVINDLQLTVKFIPTEYLAYKEAKSLNISNQKSIDSLLMNYQLKLR